jgi:hypothetical protein
MLERQLKLGPDEDGVLAPTQVSDVGVFAPRFGGAPHIRAIEIRNDAAHPPAPGEEQPAATVAAPT